MTNQIPAVLTSDGVPLVGTFYRHSPSLEQRQPAVVVCGSWLNVKEQMASSYARALSERGFTTFVFDFAGFGESGGALRHFEDPLQKARDIANAAAFVQAQSFVLPDRVHFLGVCASAQYGLRALGQGAPFASYAAVAGWFHDAATLAPFYGGDGGVALRIQRAERALTRFRQTGTLDMVPAYAPGDDRAGMHFDLDYYGNPERGAVPAWSNQMAEITWLGWLRHDGVSPASSVSVPTLFVHGEGCALPDNVRRVHGAVRGRKDVVWLEGEQQDFYDRPRQTSAAVERVSSWFNAA